MGSSVPSVSALRGAAAMRAVNVIAASSDGKYKSNPFAGRGVAMEANAPGGTASDSHELSGVHITTNRTPELVNAVALRLFSTTTVFHRESNAPLPTYNVGISTADAAHPAPDCSSADSNSVTNFIVTSAFGR